jgi:hypothetical protein
MLDTALYAGVSPKTLRKIEAGRITNPAFTTIAAIVTPAASPSTPSGPNQPTSWRPTRPFVRPSRPSPSRWEAVLPESAQ